METGSARCVDFSVVPPSPIFTRRRLPDSWIHIRGLSTAKYTSQLVEYSWAVNTPDRLGYQVEGLSTSRC